MIIGFKVLELALMDSNNRATQRERDKLQIIRQAAERYHNNVERTLQGAHKRHERPRIEEEQRQIGDSQDPPLILLQIH